MVGRCSPEVSWDILISDHLTGRSTDGHTWGNEPTLSGRKFCRERALTNTCIHMAKRQLADTPELQSKLLKSPTRRSVRDSKQTPLLALLIRYVTCPLLIRRYRFPQILPQKDCPQHSPKVSIKVDGAFFHKVDQALEGTLQADGELQKCSIVAEL